ncbi:MAG TPA: cytochrome P450 [Polyangia bacterium]|nr:cytochrome P450 [Polyangia bacterium]
MAAAKARNGFPILDGAYPIIGHLPEMYRRFPALCARGLAAHGPLFWIHGGPGAPQLMFADPRAFDILKHPNASTSFYSEGFSALLGNTLFAFDGDEHRRVRAQFAPSFTPAAIRKTDVLQIVTEAVAGGIDRWIDAGEIDPLIGAKEIALEIIFRVVGVPVSDLKSWRRQYSRFLLAGIPSRGKWRGPLYWIAKRARDWLDARLGKMVDDLRASGDASTLVGAMANARDEAGNFLPTLLVVSNLRLLVFAGHETTASAMAWSALHLAASPEFQRRAAEEVRGSGDLIELGTDPQRFTFAEAQFRESLRMYPPVHSVIRRATADLPVDGAGVIPRDTLVNVPFVHLMRDPSRFAEADRYSPDRFTERPRPSTLETAMFGGGPHFCLGYHIAIAEGTLFNLHFAKAMVRRGVRARLSVDGPLPGPVYLPLSHPPRGLAVTFEGGK